MNNISKPDNSESFVESLKGAEAIIAKWPKWKRDIMGGVSNNFSETYKPKQEVRDIVTKPLIFCEKCKKETEHAHMIDQAHGLQGTYISGSERYECKICRKTIRSFEGKKLGLKFVYE